MYISGMCYKHTKVYQFIFQTCAINILKDIKVYFPFINCMERSNDEPANAAQKVS